jgi:phosphatidylethanolamine/phosphatidyl-N-methylethanolamine N-methyltransferase
MATMKPDPDYQDYLEKWSNLYQIQNYDSGLAGFFLKKSHEWSEKEYGNNVFFEKVLEVGAGTGMHFNYINHQFDEYWMTDYNSRFLEENQAHSKHIKKGKLLFSSEDATHLSFPDAFFDRLIAAHVLEHLYYPHQVLHEWIRVLKPGGTLTLVLPCDPGVAWRLGRYAVARKKFISAGFDYDYWMAREHVNPINCLTSFIRYYFADLDEKWFPFHIPSIDINLFYIAHIKK